MKDFIIALLTLATIAVAWLTFVAVSTIAVVTTLRLMGVM